MPATWQQFCAAGLQESLVWMLCLAWCADNWVLKSLGGHPGGTASLMHGLHVPIGTRTVKKKNSLLYICLLFQFDVLSPVGKISVNFQNWQCLAAHSLHMGRLTFPHFPFRFQFCEMFLKLSIKFKNWFVTRSFVTQNDRKCKNSKHSLLVASYRHRLPQNPARLPLVKCGPAGNIWCILSVFTVVWCLLCILSFTPSCLTHFLALF